MFGDGKAEAEGLGVEAGSFGDDLGDEFLGFSARGAAADRDDADLEFADQVLEGRLGFVATILRRMRVDDALVVQVAVGVEDGEFAAAAYAGVDRQDGLLGDRRLEE